MKFMLGRTNSSCEQSVHCCIPWNPRSPLLIFLLLLQQQQQQQVRAVSLGFLGRRQVYVVFLALPCTQPNILFFTVNVNVRFSTFNFHFPSSQ